MTKWQRGREVTVLLAIINLTELNFHPRLCPRCSLLCVNQPTNINDP